MSPRLKAGAAMGLLDQLPSRRNLFKGGLYMKLKERLSLLKAGYSKAEIAEIEAAELIDDQDPDQEPDQDPDQEPDQDPAEASGAVADLEAKIKELEATITRLQQDNINRDQDIPEDKTVDDILKEVIY